MSRVSPSQSWHHATLLALLLIGFTLNLNASEDSLPVTADGSLPTTADCSLPAEGSTQLPKSECSFSGDFTQTKIVAGLSKTLTSTGVFYYHCEDGVIWSTRSPIEETLIFTKSGLNSRIKDQKIVKLKGRQSKLLGQLLNSMMSGNQSEIEQQFAISKHTDTNKFELLPRKKSLKRAIKNIQLAFSKVDSNTVTNNLDQISIDIRDRKNQLTSIVSSQTNTFDKSIDATKDLRYTHCIINNRALACGQLYPKSE